MFLWSELNMWINGSFLSFSKSRYTCMTYNISDKAFRTVIALVFLFIIFSTSWTDDTVSSIPERKVSGTSTFDVDSIEHHLSSLLVCGTFALLSVLVNFSGSRAWNFTFTSSISFIEEVSFRTWVAFSTDSIEKKR